ncbi:MAG: GyrI-like domain-containing protein [Saprospiraceae bacterium]
MNNTPVRIETIPEKKLVGKRMTMSFSNFAIAELWRGFVPLLKHIKERTSSDMISLAIYQPGHFESFTPSNEFEKWAAVEVSDFNAVPQELEAFILPGGLYAVFDYKGLNTDNSIFQYIYGTWLPNSGYVLDNRPHFEVLGEKYRNNDPDSEEEIWIPVKESSAN